MQAGGGYQDGQCAKFWQGLAYKTYGHHLSLSSFSNVFDFIMAIAYKEQGPEQLEVRKKNPNHIWRFSKGKDLEVCLSIMVFFHTYRTWKQGT